MKPNFALNITDTAISLLHRTSRGWLEVGSAGFDNPDLDEALGYLRSSALGLSPHGITTKLILPPGQVLYTEVEVSGTDKAAREAQIRAALEGRTPYDVDELVFDSWGSGPVVKVAVVARETLEEAEAFATTHRFNPLSFVTTPAEGQFAGEPWFGASKLAASLLPEGEKVTRDQDPVKVITREVPKSEDKAARQTDVVADGMAKAKQEAEAKAAESQKAEAQKAGADAQAAKEAAAKAEADQASKAAADEAERVAQKSADTKAEAIARERAEAEALRKTEAAKAELERRAQDLAQAEAKRLVEEAEKAKTAQIEREKTKAALIEAERKRAASDEAAAEEAAAAFNGVTDPGIAETKDSAPQPAPSFASRRREDGSSAPSLGPAPKTSVPGAAPAPEAPKLPKAPVAPTITSIAARKPEAAKEAGAPSVTPAPAASPAANAGDNAPKAPAPVKPLNGTATFATGAKAELTKGPAPAKAPAKAPVADAGAAAPMVTAARIPGTSAALSRFKSKVQSKAAPAEKAAPRPGKLKTTETAKAAQNSLGTFGDKLAPRRGKPRFLGLILTLVLLAVLAAVAAWSSIYLSRDDSAPETIQQAEGVAPVTPGTGDAGIDASPTEDVAALEPEATADMTDPEAVADAEAAADAEAELPPDVAAAEPVIEPEAEPTAPEAVADAAVEPVDEPSTEAATDPPAQTPAEGPAPALETAAITGPANAGPDAPANDAAAQAEAPGRGPQDEIFLATVDGAQPAFDAVALPRPQSRPDAAPTAAMPPPPFGTQYEFEPDGTIKATANGVIMPDGFWLIAARPPVLPPARPAAISDTVPAAVAPAVTPDPNAAATPPPDGAAAEAAGASTAGLIRMEGIGPSSAFEPDTTVESRRPRLRPDIPEPATTAPATEDDAALAEDPALTRLTSLRPRMRPAAIVVAAEAARVAVEAASLAAKAAALDKTAQDSAMTVALSPRPAARPRDFSRAVEAALAAATRETTRQVVAPAAVPEPEQADEPEVRVSAAPRIPTRANVAKQATFKNAINLSKTNLIGVYGTDSKRYALIRSSSGRYSKVRVGDRVDGGTVAAITRSEVRYKKGSRMLTLAMPKG